MISRIRKPQTSRLDLLHFEGTGPEDRRGAISPWPAVEVPHQASSPLVLEGAERKNHIQASIREYEYRIIVNNPVEAARKLDKLSNEESTPFIFFRGTADLFYRDLAGIDADRPMVLAYGDTHPENIGVLRAPDGKLFYGLDDFDESHPAPFSWDLRRGATSFELVARERGFSEADKDVLVRAYLDGYLDAVRSTAEHGPLDGPRFTEGGPNTPDFIQKFLEKRAKKTQKKYLKKYVNMETGKLEREGKLVSASERVGQLAKAMKSYVRGLGSSAPSSRSFYEVKDVAERLDAGTGSIGLKRFYTLIEGQTEELTDDEILELKERRSPVLSNHVRLNLIQHRGLSERIDEAVLAQWSNGDAFSGLIRIDGSSYKIRRRDPAHDRLELSKLEPEELVTYARMMGALNADVHLSGAFEKKHDPRKLAQDIMLSVGDDREAFVAEIREYGSEAADRVRADHEHLRQLVSDNELLG